MRGLSALRRAALVARVRGYPAVAGAAAAAVVACRRLPDPLAVPGRDGVQSLVWPLAPAIPCLVVPALAARLGTAGEVVAARRSLVARAGFVAATGTLLLAVARLGAPDPSAVPVVLRNGALLLGTALCAAVLPTEARWVPVPALVIVTWFLGTAGVGNEPAGWAVLLHREGSPDATRVSAVALALGLGALLVPDHARVDEPDGD